MNSLDSLFLVSAGTLLAALLLGRLRLAGPVFAVLYGVQFGFLIRANALLEPVASSWTITLFDQSMSWSYNALSWSFAALVIGVGFCSALYASGAWMETSRQSRGGGHAFHVALALVVLAMLLLLGASDFLTLFLGLELVGWSSFLLMTLSGGVATRAALRYITYAFSGAMGVLGAMTLLHAWVGSLGYEAVIAAIPSMTNGQIWLLLLLMGGGFSVKMGLLPFHSWQPQAYAEAPGPGSAFLGAVLGRMGLYDFIVVFISMVGMARLLELGVPYTSMSSRDLLAWIAALTILLPTLSAVRQQDARYLLIWLGIGQSGFMVLGLMVGNAAGMAGALLHVLYFSATQAALLMTVFAVMHRTGTTDLHRTGGLAIPMPLTFLVTLLGLYNLIGLPPMAGYGSKWLIYQGLLAEGRLALCAVAVIGTLGAALSAYKLIDCLFLVPLRQEPMAAREAPTSMLAPMLLLTVLVMLAGAMPDLVLNWVATLQAGLDLAVIEPHPDGLMAPFGELDMTEFAVMLAGLFGMAVIAYLGFVSPWKHPRPPESESVYAVLMRVIGPLYRAPFASLERVIVAGVDRLAEFFGRFYRFEQPVLWLLAAAVAVAAWAA